MDIKAKVLRNLSYGLYLIGVMDGERPCGCIVNTVFQVTSENPIVAISMNKNNYTWELLEREGRFAVSILSEKTRKEVIQKLGFVSGRDHDKYEGIDYTMRDGLPVLNEQCCGALICKVVSVTETPTHMVVLASVAEAYELAATVPMTYRYYHEVIRGGAPKNAPSYIAPEKEEKENMIKHIFIRRKQIWQRQSAGYATYVVMYMRATSPRNRTTMFARCAA